MKNQIKQLLSFVVLGLLITGCQSFGRQDSDSLTGWTKEDKEKIGFYSNKKFKEQKVPPGMVLIEGGTFTMGAVQDDVMFDWNSTPTKQQVRSFYMDEAEVTNNEYLFFTAWTQKVFPPENPNYTNIYASTLPDTLVWRNVLGSNELLTENYFRHPAYADYPVVGVSWVQANQYCKWRTDRLNEKLLMDKGILKDVYSGNGIKVQGRDHFSTDAYLSNPDAVFKGQNPYNKGLDAKKSGKGFFSKLGGIFKKKKSKDKKEIDEKEKDTIQRPTDLSLSATKPSFSGRHVKITDGILTTSFRLPTEVEWEYAARAVNEDREYNNIRGRKKYTWKGNYTRGKGVKNRGDQLANFKQGKGNYSGVSGWSSDYASITNKVKSYPPNAFGLYDMAGNVAEWVADVYRPIIDDEANDFNYFRGNIFTKKLIGPDGKVYIQGDKGVKYDTLDNGKLIPKYLPGEVVNIPITRRDAYMRNNYSKAYNIDASDGDLASTKYYRQADIDSAGISENKDYRMYNYPVKPKELGESGNLKGIYDSKMRTSLISDKSHVYKGGSWRDLEYWLDPSHRRYLPGYSATNYIGFRCATDRIGAMVERKMAYPKNRN